MKKTVGAFQIEVSGPFPCRVEIKMERGHLIFDHRDLRDLQHLVREAIRESNAQLSRAGHPADQI